MISSMTGFAQAKTEIYPGGNLRVEIKSINHRFFELIMHLPEGFGLMEERIRRRVQKNISRGRVSLNLFLNGSLTESVSLNKELVKGYLAMIKDLQKKFHLKGEIKLGEFINLAGIFVLKKPEINLARISLRIEALVDKAISNLVRMRQIEGRAIAQDIKKRLNNSKTYLKEIKQRIPHLFKEKEKMLSQEEFLSYVKSCDVSEEIMRINFYFKSFKEKMKAGGPVGKELDFISQELQREINTLMAKSQDVFILKRAIKLKTEVERIREQLQNVE